MKLNIWTKNVCTKVNEIHRYTPDLFYKCHVSLRHTLYFFEISPNMFARKTARRVLKQSYASVSSEVIFLRFLFSKRTIFGSKGLLFVAQYEKYLSA